MDVFLTILSYRKVSFVSNYQKTIIYSTTSVVSQTYI
nr:MAG TPA: hypothetical protein [Caudoviricetes sp.]DAR91929.1 MAG TPA: hypothetical protein [Bacteriophage sp.]